MRSTFSGLNAVNRGLYANQIGLDTVGHNISNANTAGYSRQLVTMTTTNPESIYGGQGFMQVGTGVSVQSILRARDTFTDRQYWKENASLGYGQMADNTLSKIEGVFREPSEYGLQTVLNKFWTALQTLSTNGSDDGARAVLQQRGVEVRNAIEHAATQLKDMAADINSVIEIKVNNVNQIASDILSLNKQICTIETGGSDHANDLRDRRDLLVDQLSSLVGVTVNEDKYGNYSVQSGSITLVDGNRVNKLGIATEKDPIYGYEIFKVVQGGTKTADSRFTVGGTEAQLAEGTKGEIQGLLDMRDLSGADENGVKGYLDKLATISQFLLVDFNGQHRDGCGLDDSSGNPFTGNNFFGAATNTDYSAWVADASKTNGDWLREFIGADIVSAEKIAARSLSSEGVASGSNATLLSNVLKTKGSPTLGVSEPTLDAFYNSFIGKLGVQSQEAKRLTENQGSLVQQITTWRESVAGVNMDEEMTNMIRFQKGYNAAARVITTMDEMLDKLINGTGVVGR